MQIPRIIHQTWKNDQLPKYFRQLSNTWQAHHPDWEYRLWTDDMNLSFVEENFSEFLEIYKTYEHNIQRIDVVRYLILYKTGGVFIDLDFQCLKNMDDLLRGCDTCLFGQEPALHCQMHKKDLILSNAFIASVPGCRFFNAILDEIQNHKTQQLSSFDNILESTGPFMLTRAYQNYSSKQEVYIASDQLLYPLTKEEIQQVAAKTPLTEVVQNKLAAAFAVHYYSGTWWQDNTWWQSAFKNIFTSQ